MRSIENIRLRRRWVLAVGLAMVIGLLPATLNAQEGEANEAPAATEVGTSPAEPEVAAPGAEEQATDDVAEVASGAVATSGAVLQASGEAVTSAAVETADTMVAGGEAVLATGDKAVNDWLIPIWARFAAAFPSVLKAFLVLLGFWIAAILVSRSVAWLLGKTTLDQRLVKEWGIQNLFESKETGRTVESTVATVVKWFILLFGFVAFFDALELGMVAGPLQNILNQITSAVPKLLKAAVILLGYWVLGSILRVLATKGLQAMKFDDRVGRFIASRKIKGEDVGPSGMVGRLLFYVVLLFGLPPFLDALGQQAIVSPMRDMLGKVLDFVPNLVAALILLLIGKVVATIVREVVTNFLAATGVDRFAAKWGFGGDDSRQLSAMIGSVAFFFAFIPIIVAAVDALRIEAVSGPVKGTLEQVMQAIPLIFVALVIMAIGYYVAKAIRGLLEAFLNGVGFDELPSKLGLAFLTPKEGQLGLSSIAGTVVMAVILLLTAQQALATLQLGQLSELVAGLLGYLPQLLVGLVIILAALSLSSYAADLLNSMLAGSQHGRMVAMVAKFAIIFLGFSMGLNQLGVGEEIVRLLVAAVLFGTALALGLAFGLGGRDKAKSLVDKLE